MRGLLRRLSHLERVVDPPGTRSQVIAVALNTGTEDLMLVNSEWILCPDPAVLDRYDGPLKVYSGFDPREVLACSPRD